MREGIGNKKEGEKEMGDKGLWEREGVKEAKKGRREGKKRGVRIVGYEGVNRGGRKAS